MYSIPNITNCILYCIYCEFVVIYYKEFTLFEIIYYIYLPHKPHTKNNYERSLVLVMVKINLSVTTRNLRENKISGNKCK